MDFVRNTVNDRPLVGDYSLDSHVSQFSGETVYTICDAVGCVFSTIFPQQLERFYADSQNEQSTPAKS